MGNCLCGASDAKRSRLAHEKHSRLSSTSARKSSNFYRDALEPVEPDPPGQGTASESAEAQGPWDAVHRWLQLPGTGPTREAADSAISVSMHSGNEYFNAADGTTSPTSVMTGCVPMPTTPRMPAKAKVPARCVTKVPYGHSMAWAPPDIGPEAIPAQTYHESDCRSFKLRSKAYTRTRTKEPSQKAIYELVSVDLFHTNVKHWHIARRMQLPAVPAAPPLPDGKTLDEANMPPLLILHIMMPLYPATFFPTTDGSNCSFIYYFRLPEGFKPEEFHTQEALKLLQRLATPHPDPTAQTAIRQQVKMIASVVNPQQWHESGKLSRTELRLLESYNAKPVLMRPCQRFFRGPNYLEIDFDLHSFSYFARKSLESYIGRLQPCIWDHGFCIEGRTDGELPEVLLGAVRGFYWDFTDLKPFPQPALLRGLNDNPTEAVTDDGGTAFGVGSPHADDAPPGGQGPFDMDTDPILVSGNAAVNRSSFRSDLELTEEHSEASFVTACSAPPRH